jgi:hypothetical protein
VLVIGFFQLVVLQQNIPNLFDIALGTGFVLLGLTLFVYGLNLSEAFVHKVVILFSVLSHRVVLHWQPHWQLQ